MICAVAKPDSLAVTNPLISVLPFFSNHVTQSYSAKLKQTTFKADMLRLGCLTKF